MAFPAGLTTCVVTAGSTLNFGGMDGSITLTVTPVLGGNASHITWSATGQPLVAFSDSNSADAGTVAQVVVPHVDQAGFIDGSGNAATMWSYRATITAKVGRESKMWVKNFQPLAGQDTIDLDLLPDGSITSPTSAPIPAVTSVNGQTGAVTVAGATDADIAALVTDPATDTGAALASVFARLGEGVCNVLDTGNPLTDAIADGTAHPLSERFTTLTDAQQVFPRATDLTEQIDRHALQLALDTYGCVIAPDGTGDYRIDSTVYTSAADTARGLGNQAFIMPGVRNLKPVDGATNATWFASGNARTSGVVPNATTATAPPCDNLYLRVRLDGNKGNVTGGGAWGYYTVNCSSVVHDVEVFNVAGGGFVIYGVTDGYTQNVELRRVWAHGCTGANALQVSLRHRKVTYVDVRAWDNTQSGVFFDHSESRSSSIQAWGNGGTGIEVHNTSRNNLSGLRATGNGGHGILISGVTHCVGSDWLATGNGTAGTQYNDVHFDARSGSYGTSKASRFDSIACGAYVDGGDPKTAGYALFVEDGVTDDVLLSGVKVTDDEVTGGVRVPAAPGKLAVQAASAGSATQRWVCGGPERCVVKAADQTVNNSTTLADDAELKFNVAAGETWTVDYTLKVTGSDTTADFQFGLTTPTGTSGDIYIVQGGALADTGGSGAAQLGWKGVGGTLSVAAFASTNPVVVRAAVTAGADGTVALRWAQNTATASDLSVSAGSFLHARRA